MDEMKMDMELMKQKMADQEKEIEILNWRNEGLLEKITELRNFAEDQKTLAHQRAMLLLHEGNRILELQKEKKALLGKRCLCQRNHVE